MSKLYTLTSAKWQVGILPETGASVAFGRIQHGNRWLDFMRPTPEAEYRDPSACASYVLIPWSNRIREGQFRFKGKDYRLRVNFADGTAIHGTAKEFPWGVDSADDTHIVMRFASNDFSGVNYPFRFSTRVEYRLDGERFTTIVWLKNEDKVAMPAGIGHHPYFMRTLDGPNDTVQLEIPCSQHFVLENCLPSAGPVPVEPRVDFQKLRPLGDVFIDDCLAGRAVDKPIRFVYTGSGVQVSMQSDAACENVVLYVPQKQTFFAVEPVTNANDGFNLYDKGISGSGMIILEPGQEKQVSYSLVIG